jgi:hypothetical protein
MKGVTMGGKGVKGVTYITLRQLTPQNSEEMVMVRGQEGMRLWIDWLKERNILVFLKGKITSPASRSDLNLETYILCMQTPF